MSSLAVSVLSRFTKPAPEDRHSLAQDLDQALGSIQQIIPDVAQTVRDKTVLDFGSGEGWHAILFGMLGAQKVYGIEIEQPKIERSRERAREQKLDGRVQFEPSIPGEAVGACDFILSRDSMEHYEDPEAVLRIMKQCLRPGGKIIISFGPTWYSPYGAHMNYFAPIPWVHLLFSEESIMTLRARYRDDGAKRYHEVPGGLNKMSVARFERLIRKCELTVAKMKHHCVRGNNWLGKIPVFRELFISSIECHLQ